MEPDELRTLIYGRLAATGTAPTRIEISDRVGGADRADRLLRDLHDRHAVVVGADGEISMALPFAAHPTQHRVISTDGSWWANCAWDSLAIPVAIGTDATIDATWLDSGEPVELAVAAGAPTHTDGFVHFQVAARHWWDDIVET